MEFIVEDYSDKSFVVRGADTTKIKDKLMEMGGRYNRHLKCGAGWLFSIRNKENVIKYLNEVELCVYVVYKDGIIHSIKMNNDPIDGYNIEKIPIGKIVNLSII